ncbi:MAG: hypothetical protein A2X49_04650 [Lentisphaerae bacterium GWF2_52_8]|nr:MAG: hypothetical protein A2X49_04650 [Lentisphaerae bacterium GWF2_52_8]
MAPLKIVLLMVDGFGVPPEGWENSMYARFGGQTFAEMLARFSTPLDACLGVDGLPQSATGQTTLFTGINAAAAMNTHLQGFPGPSLRKIIRTQNLFSSLVSLGKKVSFANAYVKYGLEELARMRLRSVTTVMVQNALGEVLRGAELLASKAVYHDLTRASIADEYGIPRITPSEAARDLINIADLNDLTLFEYFLTDKAGHSRDEDLLSSVIGDFSEFLQGLACQLRDNMLLIFTSDHGNCEDLSSRGHTRNPVPFFLFGTQRPALALESIADVEPEICSLLQNSSENQRGNAVFS